MDEIDNLFFSDGGFDGEGIVLKDADQALLNVLPIYVLGVLDEQIDPSGEIELVLAVADHYFFKESIDSLEHIRETHLAYSIHRRVIVVFDVPEAFVELEDYLDQQLSSPCIYQDLLDDRVRSVTRRQNLCVGCPVYFSSQQF